MKPWLQLILMAAFGCSTLTTTAQDGTLDASFNGGMAEILLPHTVFNSPTHMAVQSDGKIVTTGFAVDSTISGRRVYLTRYTTAGVLDNSFGTNGVVFKSVNSNYCMGQRVIIQPDGKIVVGVNFMDGTGFPKAVQLTRFLSNGTIDSAFGTNGSTDTFRVGSSATVTDLILQSDGKLLLGLSDYPKGAIVRYNADGSRDNTFNGTGFYSWKPGFNGAITLWLIQNPDNSIMAAGSSSDGGNMFYYIRKFKVTGVPDSTFNGTGLITNRSFSIYGTYVGGFMRQTTGKYILAGHNGYQRDSLLAGRLNADGSVDNSFNVTIEKINGKVSRGATACLEPDDRILIAGVTDTTLGGNAGHTAVTRFNVNGGKDNSFGSNGSWVSTDIAYAVSSVKVQPDGKVLVASYKYDIPSDLANQAIYRLNNTLFTGIEESQVKDAKMYPNPVSGLLHLPGAVGRVQVYSLIGGLVLNGEALAETVELSGLPAGTYVVQAETEGRGILRQMITVR
ncbi:MAG: T9SS type A sorting domain-containing protein [Chitinophagales bacterium]